jgi:hypothetical protein
VTVAKMIISAWWDMACQEPPLGKSEDIDCDIHWGTSDMYCYESRRVAIFHGEALIGIVFD